MLRLSPLLGAPAEPRLLILFSHGSAVEALSRDGMVEGFPDDLSMLLGPAHLGYIRAGHGGGRGRREAISLSVRNALVEVSRGVCLGEKTMSKVDTTVYF